MNFGPSQYKIVTSEVSFDEASATCASQYQGNLVEIETQIENSFLHVLIEYLVKNGTITGNERFMIGNTNNIENIPNIW